jgi:hypothetical protein
LNGFEESRWHKRGWTLQELLAPAIVEFYDLDWNMAETRFSLRERISTITGIRTEILTTKFDFEASQNLHCVKYGEGRRAFERLQFQILAETEDLTLFAWHGSPNWPSTEHTAGVKNVLAQSPSDFHEMTNMYTYRSLEAGSYNKVWAALNVFHHASTPELVRIRSEFVPEQPVKRLDTVVLSIGLLLSPKKEKYGSQDSLILCRIGTTDTGITGNFAQYLCLPVRTRAASMLYWKRGQAKPTSCHKSGIISELRSQRISISLREEQVSLARYETPEFPRYRPSAFIFSMQGQRSSSKQFILCENWNPPCTVLL